MVIEAENSYHLSSVSREQKTHDIIQSKTESHRTKQAHGLSPSPSMAEGR